jgi:hypothetical protein
MYKTEVHQVYRVAQLVELIQIYGENNVKLAKRVEVEVTRPYSDTELQAAKELPASDFYAAYYNNETGKLTILLEREDRATYGHYLGQFTLDGLAHFGSCLDTEAYMPNGKLLNTCTGPG